MNKLTDILIAAAVLFIFSGITNAHAADSDGVPCGALELIKYAAGDMDPDVFYNNVLFDKNSYLDYFAKNPNGAESTSGQRKYYYENFCNCNECEKGTYYSYENFKAALDPRYFEKFCCENHMGTEERLLELAEFLATVASETTAGSNHNNDGFYFRYENDALNGETMDVGPQKGDYVPSDQWKVARSTKDKTLYNTQIFWYEDELTVNKGIEFHPDQTPCGAKWQDDIKSAIPDGYELCNMNEIIQKGYWVGMGPTQLTGDTMFGFFGWYHNNVEKKEAADYAAFVQRYLKTGELGFLGALWYWNARVAGIGLRTVHEAVTLETDKVCHGISCATLMVNGGCNDFLTNRYQYFLYFVKKLLPADYPVLYSEEYTKKLWKASGWTEVTKTLDTMNCPCSECPKPGPTEDDQDYWTVFLKVCRDKY